MWKMKGERWNMGEASGFAGAANVAFFASLRGWAIGNPSVYVSEPCQVIRRTVNCPWFTPAKSKRPGLQCYFFEAAMI
jgi:hypothetical protein